MNTQWRDVFVELPAKPKLKTPTRRRQKKPTYVRPSYVSLPKSVEVSKSPAELAWPSSTISRAAASLESQLAEIERRERQLRAKIAAEQAQIEQIDLQIEGWETAQDPEDCFRLLESGSISEPILLDCLASFDSNALRPVTSILGEGEEFEMIPI